VNVFEITIEDWIAREHGDEIARATLGQLELRCGDRFLTLLEDRIARTNRTFANLSAYDLAVWLASNWWRLRWEPERKDLDWLMSHSLAAIGRGYIWPNVTVLSDGEQIQIQTRPTSGKRWEPVRYLEYWDCTLTAAEFELAVDAFVDCVLARLANLKILGTELQLMWDELQIERRDPEVASVRRLEALLGLDAGAAPDALIDALSSNAQKQGRTAVDEVVAEFRSTASDVLELLDETLQSQGTRLDSSSVNDLSRLRDEWSVEGPPWKRAERAAKIAREIWNMDGRPVANAVLAGLVGADEPLITGRPATDVPMAAAKWTTPERKTWDVILRSNWEGGKRFELCRLIGDGLIAPEGELLLPATRAKTSRQKFQRAFAQEFLCPFEALLERLGSRPPDDDEIESAARHFGVSPLLIRSTLANKDILPRF
jgi:hypothetical protein